MTEWLTYLMESSLCLAGSFLVYHFFLRRSTHFAWNRAFLLAAIGLAVVLPLAQWEVEWGMPAVSLSTAEPAIPAAPLAGPRVDLPQAPIGPSRDIVIAAEQLPSPVVPAENDRLPDWRWLLTWLWALGAAVAMLRLGWRLRGLGKYLRMPAEQGIVTLPEGSGTFSFAGRIYLDDRGFSPREREMVLRHERAHLRLFHFGDNLLLEAAAVLWWFHPLLPGLRAALRGVHEYQADAAASPDALSYSRLILKLADRGNHRHPASAFAASNAGRRIEMLHRKPGNQMTKLKYLLLLPVLATFIFAFVLIPADVREIAMADRPEEGGMLAFAGEKIPVEWPHVQTRLQGELNRLRADASLATVLQKRASEWQPKINAILTREGIPTDFFYIAVAESHLRLNVKSPGGAGGMWQFLPGTARLCGLTVNGQVDQRMDPELATKAACRYISDAHRELGSWVAAAVAYNRGVPGYRNFLSNRNASSYFEVKDVKEKYLYRILAYKLLMSPEPLRGEAPAGMSGSHPPHIRPLGKDVEAEVSSPFGPARDPFDGGEKQHQGIDLKAPLGSPVVAPADGEVLEVGETELRGKFVVIRHDAEYTTRYFHLDGTSVEVGAQVKTGQEIGKVGSTGRSSGPHLHYEVIRNGQAVDPAGYFNDPEGRADPRLRIDWLNGVRVIEEMPGQGYRQFCPARPVKVSADSDC